MTEDSPDLDQMIANLELFLGQFLNPQAYIPCPYCSEWIKLNIKRNQHNNVTISPEKYQP